MSNADLDRLRNDIESIREVAGLGLPFGWEDVALSLALAPCGVALALVGAFAPQGYARLGLLPALGVVLAGVSLRIRFRRGTGRSPARRREYTLGLAAGLLYGTLAGAYLAWARSVGEPTRMTEALAVSLAGGLCAVLAMTGPGRRSLFAAAATLIAYGLVLPFCSPRQVVVAGGVAVALAGLAGAAIQAWQLRAIGGGHEPAAH